MGKGPFAAAFGLVSVLSLAAGAQTETKSVLIVGGEGSCSSEGTCDPGLLNDGVSAASTRLTFTLVPEAGTLTVEAENTSPVVEGVPNPLLSRIYFNTPEGVTDMTLSAQTADGARQPGFELVFRADRCEGRTAGPFGRFNARLKNPSGIPGSIANPAAGIYATSDVVLGPATFVFSLTGDLTNVTALDFASHLSCDGTQPSTGVSKFQGGGDMACFSAYINQGAYCNQLATTAALGTGCGATIDCGAPVMGELAEVVVDGSAPFSPVIVLASPLTDVITPFQGCELFLNLGQRMKVRAGMTDENGDLRFTVRAPTFLQTPECCGFDFVMQAVVLTDAGPLPIGEITNAVHIRLGS